MKNWKISIIIVSHNATNFLSEAYESAKSQTFPAYEILVIGDSDHKLITHNIGDVGMHKKFNYGAKIAKGNALIHLCEDDKLAPDFIEKTYLYLNSYDIVYTDMHRFGNLNEDIGAMDWTLENMKISTVPFITSLIKKEMWKKVGGYAPDFGGYGDWDFWWSCMEKGATAKHIKEPLFHYRISDTQASNTTNDHYNLRLNTLKKHQ